MAIEDSLKIILTASLDDESYQSILAKIEKIRGSVKDIKIKITEEGNFAQQLDKLIQNIDTLNKKMDDYNKTVSKGLDDERKKKESNAEFNQKQYEKEIKQQEELKKQRGEVQQTETKYDAGGKVLGQTRVYGDDKVKDRVTYNEKGIETGNKQVESQKKIREEAEKLEKIQKTIPTEIEAQTKEQKRFLDLQQKLVASQGKDVNTRKELTGIADELSKKEEIRLKALARQKELEEEINRIKKVVGNKKVYEPLETAKNVIDPKNIVKANKTAEEAQKEYNKQLDVTKEKLQKVLEAEKNYQKINEKRPELRQREKELAGMGYDTSQIKNMIDNNLKYFDTNKEVTDSIKAIEKELKELGGYDKNLTSLDEKAKKLGISFQRSFKNLKDTGDLNALQTQLSSLHERINQLKTQGNAQSRQELQTVQALVNELQREADIRKLNNEMEARQRKEAVRIRGDRTNFAQPEEVDKVFDTDRSHLEREDSARAMARAYLEETHGLQNVNAELIRVNHNYDDLHGTTTRVTYDYRDQQGEIRRYTVAIDQATRALHDMGVQQTRLVQQQGVWDSISASMRRVPAYMASFGLFYEAMNLVTQSFKTLYDIDQAMTDLAKVTELTTSEVEAFRLEASLMGQELGSTTSEVVNAITEMQKLGYTFEQSKALGETSLIYANVGDMNVEDASNALTSALAGFGVEQKDIVEKAREYSDIFNEVGNRFAVSSAGIGEALKRSSAVLAEGGNNIEQSVAMIASANRVIQDEKKVGTAMKTISMRLRGVDEATGDVIGVVPELQDAFRSVGVEMMKDAQTFKSTYEIFDELSKVWGTLSDMEQANLVELIGGKHQGTVVSAMLGNWTDATKALEVAQNSGGSASREFAKYQESLVYRVDELKASLETLWITFWDNDAIKGAISALTDFIQALTKVIDTVGSLSVVGGTLLPIFAMFSTGLRNHFRMASQETTRFGDRIRALGEGFGQVATMADRATFAVSGFLKATLVGFLIGVAIELIVTGMQKLINSSDERIAKLKEEYEAQSKIVNQMQNFDFNKYQSLEGFANAGQLEQNSQELADYQAMQQELLSYGNEYVAFYDNEGKAVLKSAESLRQLNEQKREELRLKSEAITKAETERATGKTGVGRVFEAVGRTEFGKENLQDFDIGTPVQKLEFSVDKVKKAKDELNALNNDIKNIGVVKSVISDSDLSTFKTRSFAFYAEVNKVRTKLGELKNTGQISEPTLQIANNMLTNWNPAQGNISDEIDKMIAEIESSKSKLGTELESFSQEVQDRMNELNIDFEQAFKDALSARDIDVESSAGQFAEILRDAYMEALSSDNMNVKDGVGNFQKNIEEALKLIEDSDIDMAGLINGVPSATNGLRNLASQTGLNAEVADVLNYFLANQSTLLQGVGASANMEAQGMSLSNMYAQERNAIIADYTNKATVLASAIQAVNAGESLSLNQVNQLITLYPELSSAITQQNGVYGIQEQALLGVAEQEEASAKTKLNATEAKIKADIVELEAFIDGKEAQVKALQFLDKAYMASAKTSAEIVGRQMAYADAAAEKQRLLSLGFDKTVNSFDWKGYAESRVHSYTAIVRGQAKSALGELQRELGNIQGLKNLDLSATVQKTEAPLKVEKAPKEKKPAKEKEVKETKEMVWVTDEFKETMRRLNDELTRNRGIMMDYPTYSKEYQKGLKTELSLIKQQIGAVDKQSASLENQIKSGQIKKTGLVEKDEVIVGTGAGGTVYTVKRGDTLGAIAKKYNTTYQKLAELNKIKNANKISVGQKINIGGAGGAGGGKNVNWSRTLQQGSKGNDVKELQRMLGVSADGIFGKKTQQAVKDFQKKMGIAIDGIVGKQTRAKLGGGAIAGNASAEVQQAIDQAKDELSQLNQQRLKLREDYYSALKEFITSEVDRLDREAKKIEVNLADNDFLAMKLNEQSDEFRANREARLKLLQTQANANADSIEHLNNELTSAENSFNEKLTDEIYDMIDEQKKKFIQQQQEIYDLQKEIAQSRVDQILDLYDKGTEESERKIADIERRLNDYAETDLDKYALTQEDIRREYAKQIRNNEVRLKQLEAEENVVKNFPDLYEEWKKSIADLTEEQKDLNETIQDSQRDQLDKHEEVIDELIDNVKDYYEEQQDIELDAIDDQIDAMEKSFDERQKMYEDDLKAYEKNIDEQLKKLDELENKRQYEKELGEKQKTRQELIEQIGLLSLDTSQQGQQRKRQLEEELSNITEDIAETQRQKQLEERRKSLEDELTARQEETEKITQSDEERYNKQMEEMEKYSEEVERKWENLIENERIFAQMREDLLAGNTGVMTATIDQFQKDIEASSALIGESISQNLIDKLEQAQTEFSQISPSFGNKPYLAIC